MADVNVIKAALAKLDLENDEHWTNSGDPRIDVVQELTGDKSLKRPDITAAAPKFSRKTPEGLEPEQGEPEVPEDDAPVVGEQDTQEKEDKSLVDQGPAIEDEMSDAEDQIAQAERAVSELEAAVDSARRELSKAQAYRDELIFERDRNTPRNAGQLEIMRHLEAQRRKRFGEK